MKQNILKHKIIIAFCILAALRVFIYSAVFPFFNNVDEQAHFDLVMKYSQGHLPRSLEMISPKSARYITRYGSPEYFYKPEVWKKVYPEPLWKMDKEKAQNYFNEATFFWASITNHESSQPPLYYTFAGTWMNVGSFLGLNGGGLLYWIRVLNIFFIVAVVWIAYLVASEMFPENRFITLGVPLLAAVIPQDSYYSIQGDVLSPLLFGLMFIGLVRFMRADVPGLWLGVLTGLTAAATVLVKVSNLPLLVVVFIALLFKTYKLSKTKTLVPAALPMGLFALCALMPVFIWFGWNLSVYGDLTGSALKIKHLGWTQKSFFDWFDHPIYTPDGAWTFWTGLMASFWRGEFVWEGTRLAMPAADVFYWLSSFIFVLLGVVSIIRGSASKLQKQMSWFAFGSFASLVIFMAALSVSFDFGTCFYPSQAHPYFTSGRLVSAALIPFLLLYMQGINLLLSPIKNEGFRLGVLIAIGLFITISEIIVNKAAFSSEYNLFHM